MATDKNKAEVKAGVPTDEPNAQEQAKATPPTSSVELIRRLEKSGTGRDKLRAAVQAIEEWTLKYGEAPSPADFYEYVRGDANALPPRSALLPQGTLAKVKYLLDTGDALPPGGVDQGALDLEARLKNLEHPKAMAKAPAKEELDENGNPIPQNDFPLPEPGAPHRPPGAPYLASVSKRKGGTGGEYVPDNSRSAGSADTALGGLTESGPRIEKIAPQVTEKEPLKGAGKHGVDKPGIAPLT